MENNWIPRGPLSEIMAAVKAEDGLPYVFYISGAGGVGKTVLLRLVGKELGSPDGMAAAPGWSGLLDLYHSDVNSNSGIEGKLREVFGQWGDFQTYVDERDAFKDKRQAGMSGADVEEERASLARLFGECFNRVTDRSRVVVAFDTTERMRYEVDDVQRLCGLEDQSISVLPWLVDQLLRWRNCVVLLAGRPEQEYLESALQSKLDGNPAICYREIKLGQLTADEAQELLGNKVSEYPVLQDLPGADWEQMASLADFLPIRIEFLLEIAQHGVGFDRLWHRLSELPADKARAEIDRLLVRQIMQGDADPGVPAILHFLAAARKGLSAELLRHLAPDWPLAECRARLAQMENRAYIKRRPGDMRYYLHDEMYRICDDNRILDAPEIGRLSREIVGWYDRESPEPKISRDDSIDSLYYRLRGDPRGGYEWYARQVEYAIRGLEVGQDMRLRNEMIAFLKSESKTDKAILSKERKLKEEINCDEATRWVKRLMMRGDNEGAVRVADYAATHSGPCGGNRPGLEMACADLKVYTAQAEIYLSRTETAIARLKEAVGQLEAGSSPEELAEIDAKTYAGWRRNMVLGRAHNNLGYAYWKQYRYHLALEAFKRALPYFRASDLQEEAANTSDNMGRVHASLYHYTEAKVLIEDGLQLRKAGDRQYRYGLSLVSRAKMHLVFNEPHRAQVVIAEALNIFEKLEARRGQGLAYLTRAQTRRQLAALALGGLYPLQPAKDLCIEAREDVQRALAIFEDREHPVQEPVHRVECYNELGCIWRQFAEIVRRDREGAGAVPREALRSLERSLELAEDLQLVPAYIDSCEDIAQVYFQRRELGSADLWLDKGEARVPAAYKITPKVGFGHVELAACVEEYWHLMGKISLLRGHIAYERHARGTTEHVPFEAITEAMQHYVLAAAYFKQFSPRGYRIDSTYEQVYQRLKSCKLHDLRRLEELVPEVTASYRLKLADLGEFVANTLGVALQMP